MRLHFWLALLVTVLILGGINRVFGQTMPQQQNCTTSQSGSISHTWCGPPVIIQVQAPPVTVTPAPPTPIQVMPAPVQQTPAPAPKPKKVGD